MLRIHSYEHNNNLEQEIPLNRQAYKTFYEFLNYCIGYYSYTGYEYIFFYNNKEYVVFPEEPLKSCCIHDYSWLTTLLEDQDYEIKEEETFNLIEEHFLTEKFNLTDTVTLNNLIIEKGRARSYRDEYKSDYYKTYKNYYEEFIEFCLKVLEDQFDIKYEWVNAYDYSNIECTYTEEDLENDQEAKQFLVDHKDLMDCYGNYDHLLYCVDLKETNEYCLIIKEKDLQHNMLTTHPKVTYCFSVRCFFSFLTETHLKAIENTLF